MNSWVLYAFISMFFAGVTGVIAKKGLTGISGDLGVVVRTCFVFLFTIGYAFLAVPCKDLSLLKAPNLTWLGVSALTTTASWIFYYKALDKGEVSTVALIDKGSVVIAVLLSFWFLQEAITMPKLIGGVLMVAGLFVIARG